MINPILIHNDNVSESVKQKFESQNIIDFDYLNSEFNKLDNYISKVVIQNLKIKDFNIIFIKDNLSSNYLELYGIRVAYHIRLSQELGEKRFVPIVLLSDLDAYSLNKLEPMARITFTKNVYLEPNNLQTVEKYKNKTFSEFNKENYGKDFLDMINIESPENSTNHSIANEWAIYKWAHTLEMYHPSSRGNINVVLEKISNMLYFKYLKARNKIEEATEISTKTFMKHTKNFKELVIGLNNFDGNVLIIDDEHSKGWGDVFMHLFSQSKAKEKINIINFDDFKTYEQLEKEVEDQIEKNIPDLILLDMRLVLGDHEKKTIPKDISGIQLLNKIKRTS